MALVASFERKKAVVLGVSRDKPEAQKKFKEKYGLAFPLLSDPGLEVHKRWGVWKEKNMHGKKVMGTERTTVIVAPDGTVEKTFRKVKVDGHVQNVLAVL